LPKTPRTWKGARTPSGLKRVRQTETRRAILQPRRTAAKTLVSKAIKTATEKLEGIDPGAALRDALSALDRAAKSGAIHANAAARRKSRLTRHVNDLLGGVRITSASHVTKTTSKAQAVKAAKSRIAAGKAGKAKGAQTAAGKARAALTKTTRAEAAPAAKAEATPDAARATKAKAAPVKKATARSTSAKTTAAKSTAKPAAKKSTATKATAKPAAKKSTAKK
jgi:RNA polymerase primary sigma factor